jgi:YD repeat-containing protein
MRDMPGKENISMGTTITDDGNYVTHIGKLLTPKHEVKTEILSRIAHDNSYRFTRNLGGPSIEGRTPRTEYSRTPYESFIDTHLADGRRYTANYNEKGRIKSETFENPDGSSETYKSRFGRRKLAAQTVIEGTDKITYDGNKRIAYVNGKNFSISFNKKIIIFDNDNHR